MGTGQIYDREPNWLDRLTDRLLGLTERAIKRFTYPNRDGLPVRKDPTHGRIDRDIQWKVQSTSPSSLGARVAMENTIQRRRTPDRAGLR